MAKYRMVHTKIWSDPDFQQYPPDAKLVFIYLLTNPDAGSSGIYSVTPRTISQKTDIPQEKIEELLAGESMSTTMKNVFWDVTSQVIFVVRFLAYNRGNPSKIRTAVENERRETLTPLWDKFDEYIEFLDDNSVLYKGSLRVGNPSLTITHNNNLNNNLNNKELGKMDTEKPRHQLGKDMAVETWERLSNRNGGPLIDIEYDDAGKPVVTSGAAWGKIMAWAGGLSVLAVAEVIENYAAVVASPDTRWKHRWTFTEFWTHTNDLTRWLTKNKPLENFASDTGRKPFTGAYEDPGEKIEL